jgi:hypothetical protein
MILQKFVGNIFSIFVEILLWVIPFASAIVPGIFLDGFYWVIIGFIVGILVDVYLLGPVVVLLNIRSALKNIENRSCKN